MIVTREQQERLLIKYMKDHNGHECIGFMDGVNATLELVDKILRDENTK